MSLTRVVITGIGAVSPYGIGVDRLMKGLYARRSAVIDLQERWRREIEDLTCWVGAPIDEPLNHMQIPRKFRRSMGRVAIIAYVAALEALQGARIPESLFGSGRVGVSFASTMGSVSSLEEFFAAAQRGRIHGLPSGILFQFMSNTCAANLAHALGITGRMISSNAACSSSLQALGCGVEAIQHNDQDIMLCGGAEELHPVVSAAFDLINASSCRFNDHPSQTPRPFDRDRDGTVCGEGAGAVVLESQRSARARGAKILAEVVAYATTADGTHMAQPHRESISGCLRKALRAAELSPKTIEYVNAHATGTLQGDRAEAEALKTVFGENGVAVSGFKGYFGHTLGACGALELIACLRMQEDGYLIPTLNLETIGEGCGGLDHITTLRPADFRYFAKASFALGGVNTVLILKRYTND